MTNRNLKRFLSPLILMAGLCAGRAQETNTNQAPAWLSKPLSLAEALDVALDHNGAILRGKSELESQYGVVVQTRAIALPRVQIAGSYNYTTEVEIFPFPNAPPANYENWNASIQLVQTIYQGGQMRSALRSAKLTKEQALLQYRTVIADALLLVRIAYYDVLSAADQIVVQDASVKLLTRELDDQNRRFSAGTVPRFNVLRAEVELANQRPQLIRARNAYRIGKNNLVTLLGYSVPSEVSEDLPLELTDKLDAEPYRIELAAALARARDTRPELAVLRKQELLRQEGVTTAKGGYKPTVQILGGYGSRNATFTANNDLGITVHGWSAGAQATWNIFDGFLTQGKLDQARAQHEGAKVELDNETRRIGLEVRTQYSQFIEATEVLESQKKVVEQAEEALRLAAARSDAGTGTQLDVLSAQTSLTQARSTQVTALHDYDVARARLERAIGITIRETDAK